MTWYYHAPLMSRRSVLSAGWLGMLGLLGIAKRGIAGHTVQSAPFFTTRGVVITPNDLTLGDWQERAKQAVDDHCSAPISRHGPQLRPN